jgi:vacuolar-type H+-ATPase subunit H
MAERTLLQSIREKELEANISLDVTRREAADLIEAARKEAEGILGDAEREAAVTAEEYSRAERERTSHEIGETRQRELARVKEAETTGERHLAEAVERIVRAVIPD